MPRSAEPAAIVAGDAETGYPRSYGAALWVRAFCGLMSALFAGLAVAVLLLVLRQDQDAGRFAALLAAALGLLIGAVALLAAGFRSGVVLEVFGSAGVGATVCIHEGPGALDIPWFVIRGCT